jgi:membrane protein YqaA with SNARE-associated domain
MTPILGLVIAIVAARLAPNVRALLTAVLALMVAATAVQSWDIGAALGSNPASTIRESAYWVVQAVIIAVTLAIAYGCFALRRRNAGKRGTSLLRANFTGRRGILTTSLLGTLMTVVGVAFCLIAGSMHAHNGTGSGNIPMTGVAGISAGMLLLLALSVAFVRDNRASRSVDAY